MSPAQNPGPVRHLLRRKPLRTALFVGVATGIAFTSMTAGCLPAANAALTTVKARMSDSLTDSFGIKVETSQTQDLYKDHTKVMGLLKDLGVRHIRTDFIANCPYQYTYLDQLRSQLGITTLATMGRPDGTGGGSLSALVSSAAKVSGDIFAMEGTNEWDRRGPSNWASQLRTYQQKLYQAVKANPALKNKPLYGPTLGGEDHYNQLGNLASWLDYGNIHGYAGGLPPTDRLQQRINNMKIMAGSKPVVYGETGYHDLIPTSAGHRPASDAAEAIYYPRMLLEHMRFGLSHTYGFELLDEINAPSNYRYHLGLVRYNGTKKPEFNALANLLHLSADPGPAFTTGSLAYGTTNAPSDLVTQLYQKRDGTFVLYLWRTGTKVYDPYSYKTLSVPAANFTVNLAKAAQLKVYRPTSSASVQQSAIGSSISLSVGAEVVALTIK